MRKAQKLFQCIAGILIASHMNAQSWPSPEIEQMYRHAKDYAALGDYNDAITTYRQAIALAPNAMVLYRGLADVLYITQKYREAEDALSPIIKTDNSDDTCFKILAASKAAMQDFKGAKQAIKNGLSRYPFSGLLYNEEGIIYIQQKKPEDALGAWLDGIEKSPAFARNYKDAALLYLHSDKAMWGLLYGEMYLDMTEDTTGGQELKDVLFAGYKAMFDDMGKNALGGGSANSIRSDDDFIGKVNKTYVPLTAVVSDGITTESLTMARVRFIMEWEGNYSSKYPFTLFAYMDELIKTGHFDIYNEWLFGKAESVAEYNSWNTFHDGDIGRFIAWKKEHIFKPVSGDFHNDKTDRHVIYYGN